MHIQMMNCVVGTHLIQNELNSIMNCFKYNPWRSKFPLLQSTNHKKTHHHHRMTSRGLSSAVISIQAVSVALVSANGVPFCHSANSLDGANYIKIKHPIEYHIPASHYVVTSRRSIIRLSNEQVWTLQWLVGWLFEEIELIWYQGKEIYALLVFPEITDIVTSWKTAAKTNCPINRKTLQWKASDALQIA